MVFSAPEVQLLLRGSFSESEISFLSGQLSFVSALSSATTVEGFEHLVGIGEALLEKSGIERSPETLLRAKANATFIRRRVEEKKNSASGSAPR